MDSARVAYVIALSALGLGALRLVVGAAHALSSRDRTPDDRPALAWGLAILLQIAAFAWGLAVAAGFATVWSPAALALLAGFVAALLVAAVLVLPLRGPPAGRTPAAHFAARGRDALGALAAFHALALLTNADIWREGLLAESARINLALLVVCAAGLLAGRNRVTLAAACGYVLVVGWTLFEAWRDGYGY